MKALLLVSLSFLCSVVLHAQQPGTLDPSFGNRGILFDTTTTSFTQQDVLAVQSNGNLLVGGTGKYQEYTTFKIDCYLPDGSKNTSFGTDGSAFILFPGFSDPDVDGAGIRAITLLPDGKILAAGNLGGSGVAGSVGFARFKPDGTPDSTFGTGGAVETINIDGLPFVRCMALQPDGKILIGGSDWIDFIDNTYKFYTIRCLPDGSIDESYGENGMVRSKSDGEVRSIAVQPDGKIVAAGHSGDLLVGSGVFSARFRMERYLPDGSYDISFGVNGVVQNQIIGSNTVSCINDIILQKDGKIIAAGRSNGLFDYKFTVVRYNTDGSFDNSFGNNGVVITLFPQEGGEAKKVFLTGENENRIVVAGTNYLPLSESNANFALVSYLTNGSLDTEFGNEGIQSTDLGNFDDLTAAALQKDGKIVTLGYTYSNQTSEVLPALARYYGYPQKVSLIVRIKRWLHNHTITWKGLPADDKISYYSVEQSNNNRDGFTPVAKVSGVSNLKDYSLTNSSLLQGANYYRIKAVSNDGVIRYSEVVSADNSANTASVYPNPARDYVTVQGLPANTTANISISDGSGNVRVKGVSTGSAQYRSQLTNLQPGTYYVNITANGKTETVKFVKE